MQIIKLTDQNTGRATTYTVEETLPPSPALLKNSCVAQHYVKDTHGNWYLVHILADGGARLMSLKLGVRPVMYAASEVELLA